MSRTGSYSGTNSNDHNADDRLHTVSLLDQSDMSWYADKRNLLTTISDGWNEAVVGWKSIVPFPKLVTNNNNNNIVVRKRKTIDRSLTDINYSSTHFGQNDDYWSTSSTESKAAIRCVGDDFDSFPTPHWKSNVEQGTYRYVPDNGSYRTVKLMYDDRKEWYTIRKTRPEKVSTTWHHSYKKLQREMKRQLKKDISSSERSDTSRSSTRTDTRTSQMESEPNSGENSSRSEKHVRLQDSSLGPDRPLYRVKSTKSDGAVIEKGKKMRTIHESEPCSPMSHYSLPNGAHMIKSVSDLFIENFSSRLHALEEEMNKDSKWLRKNSEDIAKLQVRTKSKDYTKANLKENMNGIAPKLPQKSETLTTDVFSVKSMGQKELKPLEKTNGYRQSNHAGDFLPSNNHKSDFLPANSRYASELDKTFNGYKNVIENTKQTLFNTLTGTKIDTQTNSKQLKSKGGYSSPSTITICEDRSKTHAVHTDHEQMNVFRHMPVIMEKKDRVKHPLQNTQAVLPEISGKRLEMNTISQRLL